MGPRFKSLSLALATIKRIRFQGGIKWPPPFLFSATKVPLPEFSELFAAFPSFAGLRPTFDTRLMGWKTR